METRALILDVALVRALGGGFQHESLDANPKPRMNERKHSKETCHEPAH